MPGHDEFLELGALAAIGEITAAEHEELAAHLDACADCREACVEYSTILRRDLPHGNAAAKHLTEKLVPRTPDAELRERFLARARAFGVEFSPEALTPVSPVRKKIVGLSTAVPAWTVAAAVLIIAASSLIGVRNWNQRTSKYPVTLVPTPADSTTDASTLKREKSTSRAAAHDSDVSELSRENLTLSTSLKHRDEQLEDSTRKLDQLNLELAQAQNERSSLLATNDRDQAQVSELNNEIQALKGANVGSVAEMVELEERMRGLKLALQEESEKLEMERQMSSVTSDVRQLMGARNLHIIDVHDVNGTGKSAQSFGRVFYSEGQTLVFYAFDLSNGKPAPSKYYFKAWGQQEAEANSVHNLGTFSIDDREQRRWILKITDPALLRGIDSVFVTAETVVDRKQPEGKPLLYAYLAGKANHP